MPQYQISTKLVKRLGKLIGNKKPTEIIQEYCTSFFGITELVAVAQHREKCTIEMPDHVDSVRMDAFVIWLNQQLESKTRRRKI